MKTTLWLCFIFLIDVYGSMATELDYEISGKLVHVQNAPNSNSSRRSEYDFILWVKGPLWEIRTTPSDPSGSNSVFKYYEVGSDGTSTYKLSQFNPNFDTSEVNTRVSNSLEQRLLKATNISQLDRQRTERFIKQLRDGAANKTITNSVNQANGSVFPFPFPAYEDDGVAPIWLAFCSSLYLDSVKDQKLPIFWLRDHALQCQYSNTAPASVVRMKEYPYLPYSTTITKTERYDYKSQELVPIKFEAPFEKGFRAASYQILKMTNYEGHAFPLSFSLTQFSTRTNQVTGDQKINEVYTGTTTKIKIPSLKTNFIPYLSKKTAITDYRLVIKDSTNSSISYLLPSGQWMKTNDIKQLKSYETDIRKQLDNKNKRTQKIIVCCLMVVFVLPYVYLKIKSTLLKKGKTNSISISY